MKGLRVNAKHRRTVIAAVAVLAAATLTPHPARARDTSGCPVVPEVSQTIDARKAYKEGAVVYDQDNVRYNKMSLSDLNRFKSDIARLSDQVMQGDSSAKACFEGNLGRWVANDPMTVTNNQQAGFEQTWALAAIALSIIKAQTGGAKISPDVLRWLRKVSGQVQAFHDQRQSKNNHAAWAALAVGASAYILHDDASWRWALASEAAVIDQVQPDGTLPLELMRGPRATAYHFFTAIALIPLDMIRRCNGGVDARTRDAISRLIALVHKAEKDPQLLARQSGQEQIVVVDLPVLASLEGGAESDRTGDRLGGNITNLRRSLAQCR